MLTKKGTEMATAYGIGTRTENEGRMSVNLNNISHGDCLLTAKDRETLAVNTIWASTMGPDRKPFIYYWTNETERKRIASRLKILEFAMYAFVGAILIYSVAAKSLFVLMLGLIGTGFYIALAHIFEQRAKIRQDIADKNYVDLVSPSMSRN